MVTQKQIQTLALALRPETVLLAFEGEIRSGKTVDMIQIFHEAVYYNPGELHAICGRDYNAIRDNLLKCNGFGLLDRFSDVDYGKEKIGGYFLTMKGYDGHTKQILLAGYDKVNQWEAILGKTINVILVDECNIADKTFIDECWARQASADKPLMLYTLNGDNPDHPIYTDYINYCKPLGQVPPETLAEMDKYPNKKGYYYYHWKMTDNPAMTPEKIERARSIYPKDSYYYKIKVLGLRGTPEGAIFAQYLDDSFTSPTIEVLYRGAKQKMDECEYLLKTGQYIKFAIGVDLGNNDAKRGTVLSLIGITRGYKNVDVIDATDCQSTESNALVHEICTHIQMWHNEIQNLNAIDSIRIDGFGAVQILIPTIRKELINRRIRTLTDLAIKFGDSAGRKARLDLNLLMISRKVLRWSQRPGAQKSKAMFKKLKYADDGLPFDENQTEMDWYDSEGYAITPFATTLTNALR